MFEVKGPILDREIVDALIEIGDQSTFFVRIRNLFCQETSEKLKEIVALAEKKEGQALSVVAHSLKSMCGNIGAQRAFQLCGHLEAEAKAERCEKLSSLAHDLVAEINCAINELKAL